VTDRVRRQNAHAADGVDDLGLDDGVHGSHGNNPRGRPGAGPRNGVT
jgi:hypothetical protein